MLITQSYQLAEIELNERRRVAAKERMRREARKERKRQQESSSQALSRMFAAIRENLQQARSLQRITRLVRAV